MQDEWIKLKKEKQSDGDGKYTNMRGFFIAMANKKEKYLLTVSMRAEMIPIIKEKWHH